MRYNDVVHGTKVIDHVLPKYKEAWEKKQGFLGENGLFRRYYSVRQKELFDAKDLGHTVW